MSGPIPKNTSEPWLDRLSRRIARGQSQSITRRSFTIGSAAVAIGWAGRSAWDARFAAASSKSALDDSVTAEGLLVTLMGVARTKATDIALDEQTIRLIRAAQCEDEAHFNNLVTSGAAPTTGRYTISDQVFADSASFLNIWVELKNIMVGLYLSSAREFALDGEYDLVEIAFQIGTVEAQHYALLRQFLGERIPADRAFPEWQFGSTSVAIREIERLGFIGGSSTSYDYPGPGDRYCRGITGLVAETATDQTRPDVTPDPGAASPVSDNATPVDTGSDATPVGGDVPRAEAVISEF